MVAVLDLAWRLAVLTSMVFLPPIAAEGVLPAWLSPEAVHGLNAVLTGVLVGRWCWRWAVPSVG